MSLKVNFDDILDLPIYSDIGIITADLNIFTDTDYCVTVEVECDLEQIVDKRKEDEPLTHCIWGRPGKHMGLFADFNGMHYTFGWWEGDEYKYINTEPGTLNTDKVKVSVVRNSGSKTFSIYLNDELHMDKNFGELSSYKDFPICLGIANEQEEAYPHNNKFAGEYHRFIINNTYKLDDTLGPSTLTCLDFEPEHTTYYSIYDISKNGNRARINHSSYKQQWG